MDNGRSISNESRFQSCSYTNDVATTHVVYSYYLVYRSTPKWVWSRKQSKHTYICMNCKVTGRRHRVSPCRSAYFASPWWLLTFDLRRRSREAALLIPESWWHLTMRLSPVSFYDNPKYKRHPYTKTDQLRISEVITGLPRPYHHRVIWYT